VEKNLDKYELHHMIMRVLTCVIPFKGTHSIQSSLNCSAVISLYSQPDTSLEEGPFALPIVCTDNKSMPVFHSGHNIGRKYLT
jgi:hypothetical protein